MSQGKFLCSWFGGIFVAAALTNFAWANEVKVNEKQGEQAGASRSINWADRLGFGAEKRVLIFHMDDLGMCHEANQAGIRYYSEGALRSGSVMSVCPWFEDFAVWWLDHPDYDIGVHLALNCEWKYYKWGPVAPCARVPRLVDARGYLYRGVKETAQKATAEEVEAEIRAQIERVIARGLKPTHLDTHMGALYARPEYAIALMKVACEYQIPAFVLEMSPEVLLMMKMKGIPFNAALIEAVRDYPMPKLDRFTYVPNGDSYEEVRQRFCDQVQALPPGITEMILHPSDESDTLKRITGSWQQRVWEAKLFHDPEVKKFLQEEGIVQTDWRDLMRRHEARQKKVATNGSL